MGKMMDINKIYEVARLLVGMYIDNKIDGIPLVIEVDDYLVVVGSNKGTEEVFYSFNEEVHNDYRW